MRRFSWGRCALGLACLVSWMAGAQAQATWPDRPVRVIVPFPASGATDPRRRSGARAPSQVCDNRRYVDLSPCTWRPRRGRAHR